MASRYNIFPEDHVRHFRLLSLLLNLGTRAVRKRFKKGLNYHKYTDLQAFLNKHKADIEKDDCIKKQQQKLLFPHGQDATVEKFDISLLITLILTYLQPGNGLRQELVNLRKIRNDLQHNPHAGLSLQEFNLKWSKLSKLLVCLDPDPHLSEEIDEYERKPFSDTEYQLLLLKVQLGEFNDRVISAGVKAEKFNRAVSGAGAKLNKFGEMVNGAIDKMDQLQEGFRHLNLEVKDSCKASPAKAISPKKPKYTPKDLKQAVQDVMEGNMRQKEAAEKYNIPPSTISYNVRKAELEKVKFENYELKKEV